MRISTVIIIFSTLRGYDAGFDCVTNCFCMHHKGDIEADCGSKNKTDIPQPTGSTKIQSLQLEDNEIRVISENDFTKYRHLRILNLTKNQLESVGNNTFSKLTSLQKLDLSDNRLQALAKPEISRLIHNLTWLSVAHNRMGAVPEGLADFVKLRYLDISGNRQIKTLQTDQLPYNLNHINLENTGIVRIDQKALGLQMKLTSIYFGHMESLEIADLADHGGIQINHDTFQHLPSLRRLVLRNCSLDGSTPALIDQLTVPHEISQRNCNTTAANTLRWYNPLLREIDFSENPGLYILPKQIYFPPTLLFLNLRKTNIPIFDSDFTRFSLGVETLDLRDSQTVSIYAKAFACLRNLSEIRLSGNALKALPVLPPGLKTLRLRNVNIRAVDGKIFVNHSAATYLDLSGNAIRNIEDGSFTAMTKLRQLNLSGNAVSSVTKRTLLVGDGGGSSALETLDLSRGALNEIEVGSFLSHRQLESLFLNDNALATLRNGTFDGLVNLRVMDLRRNDILDVFVGAFSSNSKLQVLHLEHNRIQVFLPGVFSALDNLRELYLQFNELSKVHHSPLPGLRILDISGNKLRDVPDIGGESMTSLNVSWNPLRSPNGSYFRSRQTIRSLNLSFCFNGRDPNYSELFGFLPEVSVLDVRGNGIKDLPTINLQSLSTLYIGGNKIHEITRSGLLVNVKIIDFSKTNFTSLHPAVFKALGDMERLYLNGSYLPCTCDMKAFAEWANTHKDIVTGMTFCHWPPELVNLHESAFDVIRDLQCEEPAYSTQALARNTVFAIVIVAAIMVLIAVGALIRICQKRAVGGAFAMRHMDDSDSATSDSNCCLCVSPLKCCLQARENVYSRSRMRLFSNDDGEFAVSAIDKSAPA